MARWTTWASAALMVLTSAVPALGSEPAREIVTPHGLRVWLVEDHSAPLLTIGFRFAGGSAQDPAGKEGLANLTAESFLQGAGAMSSDAYLRAWNDLGAETIFEARNESLRGTLKVLTKDREAAAALLHLALVQPRMTGDGLNELREQVQADIEEMAVDPESIGYAAYAELAHRDHPLARPVQGTVLGVAAITAADIAEFRRRTMSLDGLTLAAVGDTTAADVGALVDRIFDGLPRRGDIKVLTEPAPPKARRLDIPMAASEAEVVFGVTLDRLTPRQRLTGELLNYSFGGSAFTSRLYRQIRDRRGLAYAIGTSLDNYSVINELTGTFGAEPANIEQAIALAREEFARLSAEGPSDAEVGEAKAALAGQYLRGLIRQVDLANELTLRQAQGFQPDYVGSYAASLADVSPDEVRAFARSVDWLDRLVVVTVGANSEPASVKETGGPQRSRGPGEAPREP